jgi:hypothetical protein
MYKSKKSDWKAINLRACNKAKFINKNKNKMINLKRLYYNILKINQQVKKNRIIIIIDLYLYYLL